ncbi:hypothetical protein [Agarilytica rhodophyticola]|uniref:hypothetical protein n=1 Tax=Agarilytica rhodophyticola TaxID=1737490 RepID=UPI000B341FF3|nr:hypothetical protein [Agarilytica rhodophyticola]
MSDKLKIKQLGVIASLRKRRLEDVEREYNRASLDVKNAKKVELQAQEEVERYSEYQEKRDQEINQEILSGVFKLEDIFLKKEEQEGIKDNLVNKESEKQEATRKREVLEGELSIKKREYNRAFINLEKIEVFTDMLKK